MGGKTLQLSEVSQISRIISDSVNKNAKIIFGISQSPQYQNKIKITLLATGCGTKGVLLKPPRALKPKVSVVRKPKPAVDQPKTGKPVIPLTKEKVKSNAELVAPEIKPPAKPKKKKAGRVIRKKPQPLKKKPKPKQRPKRKPKPKAKLLPQKGKARSTKLSGKSKPLTFSKKKVKGKPKIFIKKKPKVSTSPPSPSKRKIKNAQTLAEEKNEQKIRRNGLQLKKVIEEEERELLEQEKVWETPAILRKKDNN